MDRLAIQNDGSAAELREQMTRELSQAASEHVMEMAEARSYYSDRFNQAMTDINGRVRANRLNLNTGYSRIAEHHKATNRQEFLSMFDSIRDRINGGATSITRQNIDLSMQVSALTRERDQQNATEASLKQKVVDTEDLWRQVCDALEHQEGNNQLDAIVADIKELRINAERNTAAVAEGNNLQARIELLEQEKQAAVKAREDSATELEQAGLRHAEDKRKAEEERQTLSQVNEALALELEESTQRHASELEKVRAAAEETERRPAQATAEQYDQNQQQGEARQAQQ